MNFPFKEDFGRGVQVTATETAVRFRICTLLGCSIGTEKQGMYINNVLDHFMKKEMSYKQYKTTGNLEQYIVFFLHI